MAEWAEVLGDLAPEEIRHGLDQWREVWPPDACEFLNACRPILGSPHLLVHEAVSGSTPVGRWIRKRLGSWAITHDDEATLLRKIRALRAELTAYAAQPVEEDAPRVERKRHANKKFTREVAERGVAAMREALKEKSPEGSPG